MGAPNEWFVDSNSTPGGNGTTTSTDGTNANRAFNSLSWAFSAVTRDSADGDKFNIKGTHTYPGFSAVDIATTYGVPTQTAPLIFSGYGSTANDGVRGTLDGGDFYDQVIIGGTATDFLYVIDMVIKDSGSARPIDVGDHCMLINCVISGSSANGVTADTGLYASNCRFTNIGQNGILSEQACVIWRCVFDNDTDTSGDMNWAIQLDGDVLAITGFNTIGMAVVEECIFDLDSDSRGINLQSGGGTGESSQESVRSFISNNSFYTSGTSTYGVSGTSGTKDQEVICQNNCVEGFATTGLRLRSGWGLFHGGNAAYDNTTNFDISGDVVFTWGTATNKALSASPFTNPGTNNWAGVGSDVLEAAEPNTINGAASLDYRQGRDKGAFQKEAIGGGAYYGVSQGLHTIESGVITA